MSCKLYLNKAVKKTPNTSIGSFSKKQVGNDFRTNLLVSFFLCEKSRGFILSSCGNPKGRNQDSFFPVDSNNFNPQVIWNPCMLFQLTIFVLIYFSVLIFCVTVYSYVQDISTFMIHHWFPSQISNFCCIFSFYISIFRSRGYFFLFFFLMSRSHLLSCIIFSWNYFSNIPPFSRQTWPCSKGEHFQHFRYDSIGRFVLIITV